MIRPLTFLCMAAAFGSGLYLYSAKHEAALLDREIARTIRATQAAWERTGLLKAEWALVNEPGRLQDLSDRYLQLKPMAPTQFVRLTDLGSRLPAPAPYVEPKEPEPPLQEPAPAIVADAPLPPADPGIAPEKPTIEPVVVAKKEAAKATAKTPPKLTAKAAPRKPPHPLAVAGAEPPLHAGPLARGTPLPLAAPPPVRAQVMSAMARPYSAPARPAIVSATPRFAAPAPYVASALATGRALPPPVPYGR